MNKPHADVGVFGGSGFYRLVHDVEYVSVETPYGETSDRIALATVSGHRVAFMPRHGAQHRIPPHRINYRANVWAFRRLGVKLVLSPCAVGSLQKKIEPGHFVVVDQFVDRTKRRLDTFYDGPRVVHVSPAETYDPRLREIALDACRAENVDVHDGGALVVIEGPRFSSKAESAWFTAMGWDVVGMTQYPEAHLCRELGMAVVNLSLVTDYDSGLVSGTEAVTAKEVMEVFKGNAEKVQRVVRRILGDLPENLDGFYSLESVDSGRADLVDPSVHELPLID